MPSVLGEIAAVLLEWDLAPSVAHLADGQQWALDLTALEDMMVKAFVGEGQVKLVSANGGSLIAGGTCHCDPLSDGLAVNNGGVLIAKVITCAGINCNTVVIEIEATAKVIIKS